MLCFNKSWRNHNRETQTWMNNSVLEFGDPHQASLPSSLSFSGFGGKKTPKYQLYAELSFLHPPERHNQGRYTIFIRSREYLVI